MDGRRDPDRVVRVLGALGAGVIGLQEVDARRGADQFRRLAEGAGLEGLAAPTIGRGGAGCYGNLLLTRLPVLSERRHDLSVPGREPRGALEVLLDAGGRPLRVVVTHLGLSWRERGLQARRLVAALPEDDLPTVLLGDLNTWVPREPALRFLQARFGPGPAPATFPSRYPVLALDRAWAPARALRAHGVLRDRLARVASDHLPVHARVALGS